MNIKQISINRQDIPLDRKAYQLFDGEFCLSLSVWQKSYFVFKLSKRYECSSIAFAKALTNAGTPSKFLRLSVRLFIFLYFCIAHFTLLVYKSLIMVVENFQKYH